MITKNCAVCKKIACTLKSEAEKTEREEYCPNCNAFYCEKHHTSTGWKSVAAGVDYQYNTVTCHKGHERTLDSYI